MAKWSSLQIVIVLCLVGLAMSVPGKSGRVEKPKVRPTPGDPGNDKVKARGGGYIGGAPNDRGNGASVGPMKDGKIQSNESIEIEVLEVSEVEGSGNTTVNDTNHRIDFTKTLTKGAKKAFKARGKPGQGQGSGISVERQSSKSPPGLDGRQCTINNDFIKEKGNRDVGGENVTVKEGNVEVSVSCDKWKFCEQGSNCSAGVNATGLQLSFAIRCQKNKRSNRKQGDGSKKTVLDCGDNANVIFPRKFTMCGVNYDIADADVNVDEDDVVNVILRKIPPKGSNCTIEYDPILDQGDIDSVETPTGSAPTITWSAAFFITLAYSLMA